MRFYHLKLERVGGEGATPPPPSCLVVIVLLIVILHPPFQSPMIFKQILWDVAEFRVDRRMSSCHGLQKACFSLHLKRWTHRDRICLQSFHLWRWIPSIVRDSSCCQRVKPNLTASLLKPPKLPQFWPPARSPHKLSTLGRHVLFQTRLHNLHEIRQKTPRVQQLKGQ